MKNFGVLGRAERGDLEVGWWSHAGLGARGIREVAVSDIAGSLLSVSYADKMEVAPR